MEPTNETWVSCTFSQSRLDGSSDLVKEFHPELSFVQCIVLAIALDWVYLVILGTTRGCTLYDFNAYVDGAVTKDAIGGDSRCKTPDRIIGCVDIKQFYPVGHVLEEMDECGKLRQNICNGEGNFEWQESRPPAPPLKSCAPPFTPVDSVGCIFVNIDCWVKKNENEPACLHMGAKMASPRTVADFMALRDYIEEGYEPVGRFHPGTEYSQDEGAWVWKYHGRKVAANEWHQPTNETVGRLELSSSSDFKLRFRADDQICQLLCIADV